MECTAYLCPKRKMVILKQFDIFCSFDHVLQAQSATLTIAQAFSLAYEYWQAAKERRRKERRREEECSCERRVGWGDRVIHTRENTCGNVPKSNNVLEDIATVKDRTTAEDSIDINSRV